MDRWIGGWVDNGWVRLMELMNNGQMDIEKQDEWTDTSSEE